MIRNGSEEYYKLKYEQKENLGYLCVGDVPEQFGPKILKRKLNNLYKSQNYAKCLSKRFAGTVEAREYVVKPVGADSEGYEGGCSEDHESNMIFGLAEYAGKKTITSTNLTSI